MKALPKKLLPLTLFGIAVTSLFSVQPAQAYSVTLQQVGSNVVATGSGAINLTGLDFASLVAPRSGARLQRPIGAIVTGTTDSGERYVYQRIQWTDEFRKREWRSLPALAAETLSALWAFSGSFLRARGLCLRCCSIEQHDLE